jgi:hypothetical protein
MLANTRNFISYEKIVTAKQAFLLTLIYLCTFITAFSQTQVTAHIITNNGADMHFVFNSLNKFQVGIPYFNYSRLNIYFTEYDLPANNTVPTPNLSNWHLRVRSRQPAIESNGGNLMNFNRIEIMATPEVGFGSTTGWIFLNNSYQDLVINGPNPTIGGHFVDISYRVGVTNRITENTDYYIVDLEFLLEKQ